MRSIMLAAAAVLGLSACSEAAPAKAQAAAAIQPSESMQSSYPECTWGEVKGLGLSVWSFACEPEVGDLRLVADERLPGFAIETISEGPASRVPVIVIFEKAADAPIESIVEAVRAKSPGPHSATCTLQPVTTEGAEPGAYEFSPVGEAKAQWEAAAGSEDGPELDAPCGDMGPQMSGDRAFRVLEGDPTTVVFIEYGSEIPPFDPATIKPAA